MIPKYESKYFWNETCNCCCCCCCCWQVNHFSHRRQCLPDQRSELAMLIEIKIVFWRLNGHFYSIDVSALLPSSGLCMSKVLFIICSRMQAKTNCQPARLDTRACLEITKGKITVDSSRLVGVPIVLILTSPPQLTWMPQSELRMPWCTSIAARWQFGFVCIRLETERTVLSICIILKKAAIPKRQIRNSISASKNNFNHTYHLLRTLCSFLLLSTLKRAMLLCHPLV